MSVARADFVSNAAGTQPPTIPYADLSKAWAHFYNSATPPGIYRAFNVSSLIDNAVGHTTCNYTNVMANSAYCGISKAARMAAWNGDCQWIGAVASSSQVQNLEVGAMCDSNDISLMITGAVA